MPGFHRHRLLRGRLGPPHSNFQNIVFHIPQLVLDFRPSKQAWHGTYLTEKKTTHGLQAVDICCVENMHGWVMHNSGLSADILTGKAVWRVDLAAILSHLGYPSVRQKDLQVHTWQLGSGAGCFLFPDLSKGISFPYLPQHNLSPSQQASESWVLGRNGFSFEAYLFLSWPPERPLYSTDLLTLSSNGTSHYFLSINKNKVLSGSVGKASHASVRAWVQIPRVQ